MGLIRAAHKRGGHRHRILCRRPSRTPSRPRMGLGDREVTLVRRAPLSATREGVRVARTLVFGVRGSSAGKTTNLKNTSLPSGSGA